MNRFCRIKLPAVGLLLLSLWVFYALMTSPRFSARRVSLEGGHLIQLADVQRVVQVANRSIFEVNARALESQLESEFACIAEASVTCRLPDQVMVMIREREAALVWESGGRQVWLDGEGNILGSASGAGGLVVLRDIEGVAPELQGYIPGVPTQLVQAMRQALPEVTAYDYTREKGLILYVTDQSWPVYLGHTGDAQAKAAVMKALVAQLMAQGVQAEYLDLRNEQRPVFKRR